jgi:hypothetical protein
VKLGTDLFVYIILTVLVEVELVDCHPKATAAHQTRTGTRQSKTTLTQSFRFVAQETHHRRQQRFVGFQVIKSNDRLVGDGITIFPPNFCTACKNTLKLQTVHFSFSDADAHFRLARKPIKLPKNAINCS